jgi:hypothetical protein
MNSSRYYQGKFHPKNSQKYTGDLTNIVYRSSWELKFMKFCDQRPDVLEWSSEETVIPYFFPIDGKNHRYFVDFRIKVRRTDGSTWEHLVEIKPKNQCVEPKTPKRMSRSFIERVRTYAKNISKWNAAKAFCEKLKTEGRGIDFIILTETDLGV